MVLIAIILFHVYTHMVGKAELGTVSFSFQNFYFSGEERCICFYLKWCMGHFQYILKFWLIFPEMISDYGFVQIHPYFFGGIHGNKKWYIFERLNGQSREVFLVQRKMVHLRFTSPLQESLGLDIIGLKEPTQEMNSYSIQVSYSYFYWRLCKRSNNLLKLSQAPVNLGLTVSSQCIHLLSQWGQQSHKYMLLNPV